MCSNYAETNSFAIFAFISRVIPTRTKHEWAALGWLNCAWDTEGRRFEDFAHVRAAESAGRV